jgi:hypothetical protein
MIFLLAGFSYWFSGKMASRAYGAQPLDAASAPELTAIVSELAPRPEFRCRGCT